MSCLFRKKGNVFIYLFPFVSSFSTAKLAILLKTSSARYVSLGKPEEGYLLVFYSQKRPPQRKGNKRKESEFVGFVFASKYYSRAVSHYGTFILLQTVWCKLDGSSTDRSFLVGYPETASHKPRRV